MTEVTVSAKSLRILTGRFAALFFSLLLLLVLSPILPPRGIAVLVVRVAVTVMMLAAIYTISNRRRTLIAGLMLLAPAIFGSWSNLVVANTTVNIASLVFGVLFMTLVAGTILASVTTAERITADTVYGATCVYLLIGFSFAFLYSIIATLSPDAFRLSGAFPSTEEGLFTKFVYFSFVTLTTLGYGDITPVAGAAQSLATVEAISGQLFIAVLLARLVALQVAHSSSSA